MVLKAVLSSSLRRSSSLIPAALRLETRLYRFGFAALSTESNLYSSNQHQDAFAFPTISFFALGFGLANGYCTTSCTGENEDDTPMAPRTIHPTDSTQTLSTLTASSLLQLTGRARRRGRNGKDQMSKQTDKDVSDFYQNLEREEEMDESDGEIKPPVRKPRDDECNVFDFVTDTNEQSGVSERKKKNQRHCRASRVPV